MVARTLGYKEDWSANGIAGFVDDTEIPPQARWAVAVLQQLKIVVGRSEGRFEPGGTVTRAEAAVVLYRITQLD